ncbi:MAG: Cell shape determining protein MreB [Candidatus Moranbacteria bacterium GW2011_GWF2_36_839]|nr:MAG: Cell shape determining protein MreB [Candidatus Moranbacteria bacterium GW2011_GWF1_36_78]KKQ17268.1 MAG: Cell shape determining protein MreB [Candidatus Moranbacteria bacterium GW2011_GWF2_36_839]HAT73889.1 rod shape-determining protein [Candidatus Moranbacteria bacterium]HBY10968.1 rod shape-determining protein [Candidatus Moranbacteria bacterium]
MFVRKIGIDLGTANILVFVPGKGIVANEPSVVAVSILENKVLAVGNEAKEMLGRTPDTIQASRPMKDGVIADYKITEAMLKYFINKVSGRFRLIKPEVMISIPVGVTSTERRAVIDAAIRAGAKAAYVVKEPMLAAIGAGIPIANASGNMIINIGGGTSEVAVISLGGVVSATSARVGGNKFDQAIADYIKRKYSLAIGDRTAEEIKIKIGSAIPQMKEEYADVRGRDLTGGLPKSIKISSNEITEAIQDELREVINAIKKVLQETPPELSADIMDKGMVISGGGALIKNIDQLITKTIGVPSYIADDPLFCVIKGIGIALENLELYKRTIMLSK